MKHRSLVMAAVVGLVGVCLAAGLTGLWVLTAAPIGFLFGFFLRKGELCGASAFSEVVLMRDARKLGGIWILIAVSMLAFAAGSSLGWISVGRTGSSVSCRVTTPSGESATKGSALVVNW